MQNKTQISLVLKQKNKQTIWILIKPLDAKQELIKCNPKLKLSDVFPATFSWQSTDIALEFRKLNYALDQAVFRRSSPKSPLVVRKYSWKPIEQKLQTTNVYFYCQQLFTPLFYFDRFSPIWKLKNFIRRLLSVTQDRFETEEDSRKLVFISQDIDLSDPEKSIQESWRFQPSKVSPLKIQLQN